MSANTWIPDKTGRFDSRPKYSREELEAITWKALKPILVRRHNGDWARAVSEDDLVVMLESQGAVVELNADIRARTGWAQGCVDFVPREPPFVRISKTLAPERMANTRKFAIGHEAGHVLCLKEPLERVGNQLRPEVKSDSGAPDWLEWQANYCAAALLIPRESLTLQLGPPPHRKDRRCARSPVGRALVARIAARFETSADVAELRLNALGYVRRTMRKSQLKLWDDDVKTAADRVPAVAAL